MIELVAPFAFQMAGLAVVSDAVERQDALVAFKAVFLQKHNGNTQNEAQQSEEEPSEKLQPEKLAGNTRTDLDSDHEAGVERMGAGGVDGRVWRSRTESAGRICFCARFTCTQRCTSKHEWGPWWFAPCVPDPPSLLV